MLKQASGAELLGRTRRHRDRVAMILERELRSKEDFERVFAALEVWPEPVASRLPAAPRLGFEVFTDGERIEIREFLSGRLNRAADIGPVIGAIRVGA